MYFVDKNFCLENAYTDFQGLKLYSRSCQLEKRQMFFLELLCGFPSVAPPPLIKKPQIGPLKDLETAF